MRFCSPSPARHAAVVAAAFCALCTGNPTGAGDEPGSRSVPPAPQSFFRHSDVIAFTRSATTGEYRDYGVSFVAWGGHPGGSAEEERRYRRAVSEALKEGTRIGASSGTRTEFRRFIDYAPDQVMAARIVRCDGTPLLVPDYRTATYKGYPAYWFCTNNPTFRGYLKGALAQALSLGTRGIHLDDPLGTAASVSSGGCYCRYCVEGFRSYLGRHFTPRELSGRGIVNLSAFDLKSYHARYASLPPKQRPLYREFLDFQLDSSLQLFRVVTGHLRKTQGEGIPVSGNINPADPLFVRMLESVDYFCCESFMNAASGRLDQGESLYLFKLADGLRRPAAIMGSGADHAFVKERDLPGMVRCWVAEAYAFGNYFVAPYLLWAYSHTKGSHYYVPGSREEIAPLYRFVGAHRELFDGYEPEARVAVVLSARALERGSTSVRKIAGRLAAAQVPFEVVWAGNGLLEHRLAQHDLARYRVVLVPPDAVLDREDALLLDALKRRGVRVERDPARAPFPAAPIAVGVSSVQATLRASTADRPLVLHLLNRDYDLATDACTPKATFAVTVPSPYLQSRRIRRAVLVSGPTLSPKGNRRENHREPDRELSFEQGVDGVRITVPRLEFWALITLES